MTGRRVLQVLGRSAGGIAAHVAQLTRSLDGGKLTVDVAGPPDLPLEMPKPVLPLVIPDGPLLGHGGAIRTLRRLVTDGSYDVVHAHGLRAGIDTALAARKTGAQTLLTVHNLVHPDIAGRAKAIVYRPAESLAVRLNDRCFAVSAQIAQHLSGASNGTPAKVEVLHLGIGPAPEVSRSRAEVRAELGINEETALLVTASRLAPQKALDVLLRALAMLSGDAALAVLGEGPLEYELRATAAEMGVSERVRWLGFRPDLPDYLAAADVFVLSSIWEGVPLAAQEAIQLEVPVVATDVGGMPELIEDRVSGRLVPARDPGALASALDETLRSHELRARYVERAAADLERNFSTERMLDRLRIAYAGERR